jgi:hypothetical protein
MKPKITAMAATLRAAGLDEPMMTKLLKAMAHDNHLDLENGVTPPSVVKDALSASAGGGHPRLRTRRSRRKRQRFADSETSPSNERTLWRDVGAGPIPRPDPPGQRAGQLESNYRRANPVQNRRGHDRPLGLIHFKYRPAFPSAGCIGAPAFPVSARLPSLSSQILESSCRMTCIP